MELGIEKLVQKNFLMNDAISSGAKLLYQILALDVDNRSGGCWVSTKELSKEMGLDGRTFNKSLKELEKNHLIVESGDEYSLKNSKFYFINLHEIFSAKDHEGEKPSEFTFSKGMKNVLTPEEISALLEDF